MVGTTYTPLAIQDQSPTRILDLSANSRPSKLYRTGTPVPSEYVAEGFTPPKFETLDYRLLPIWKGTSARAATGNMSDVFTITNLLTSDEPSGDEDLQAALEDLRQITDEAAEEGFSIPSDDTLFNANRLLTELHRISPRRFEVYPTPDGEVAIDAPGGYGRSVVVLCDAEGGVLCLVNMDGRRRRARYSTVEMLPDSFIRDALVELKQKGNLYCDRSR